MESSRKNCGSSTGGAGPSGNYRRIIPPLNDTESDSSLEYWEERHGGGGSDSFSARPVKVKKEPDNEDADCCQRMVYKVKPPEPAFLRRQPLSLATVALSEAEVVRRQVLRTTPDRRFIAAPQQSKPGEKTLMAQKIIKGDKRSKF